MSNINQVSSLKRAVEDQNEYALSIEGILPDVYMFASLVIGFCLLLVLKRIRILFRNDSDESNNNLVSQLLSKQ